MFIYKNLESRYKTNIMLKLKTEMEAIMKLVKARDEDYQSLKIFFEMMVIDTFKKNRIYHLKKDLNQEISDKMIFLKNYFETHKEKRRQKLFIIKKSKKIIGSIAIDKANDLIVDSTHGLFKNKIEIGSFFIHPDYQRQGLGQFMLKESIQWMKNNHIEAFCLDSGYPLAQIFWQKHLGRPLYDFKDFWEPGSRYMIWLVSINEMREGAKNEENNN